MNIIQNLLQIVGVILGYLGSLDKNKGRIILNACVTNAISILSFAITGRIDGALSAIIIWIRNLLFLRKDKYKTSAVVWVCVLAHTIVGILSFKDVFSLIAIITPIVICIVYWYGSVKAIKVCGNIANAFWLLYYLNVGLYIIAINTFINIVLATIALISIYKSERGDKSDMESCVGDN